tara:strand:+ start:311 stop:1036 length:726 start_codon:yes stop_codon:yes gene_type:complete
MKKLLDYMIGIPLLVLIVAGLIWGTVQTLQPTTYNDISERQITFSVIQKVFYGDIKVQKPESEFVMPGHTYVKTWLVSNTSTEEITVPLKLVIYLHPTQLQFVVLSHIPSEIKVAPGDTVPVTVYGYIDPEIYVVDKQTLKPPYPAIATTVNLLIYDSNKESYWKEKGYRYMIENGNEVNDDDRKQTTPQLSNSFTQTYDYRPDNPNAIENVDPGNRVGEDDDDYAITEDEPVYTRPGQGY